MFQLPLGDFLVILSQNLCKVIEKFRR